MRFQWSAKQGWHLFGTRHRLFDKNDPEFGCAIDIFLNKYADDIETIIKKDKQIRGAKEIIIFCEFLGPHSFAGQHDPKHPALCGIEHNDPKDVVLFDVNVHKKGFLTARDFVNIFGHLHIPQIVYEGNITNELIETVKQGKLGSFEGVVCKGCQSKPPHGIWMVKIKSLKYLEELKKRFASDYMKYWE